VRKWTIAGLLPHASRVAVGWGPPSTAQSVATGRQLLRLCRYRYEQRLGRLDVVAANLLLDGFVVDLDRARRGMQWAKRAFAADAIRSVGDRRGMRERWLQRAALEATSVAAMPGLDRVQRALVLGEVASLSDGQDLSRFLHRALRRTTHANDQVLAQLRPVLSKPTKAEIDRVELAPDDQLLAAAAFVGRHPDVMSGLERIRSHRTRTIRRLVMFSAVVSRLDLIAEVGLLPSMPT
jgi:hypothetical protein